MCLGTIVSGHSRVGPIMYGHKRGGTGIDNMKALVTFKTNDSISEDAILMLKEMYPQQYDLDQYSGDIFKVYDVDGNSYTGIMRFMIICLKSSEPYVIRAVRPVPKVKISLKCPESGPSLLCLSDGKFIEFRFV